MNLAPIVVFSYNRPEHLRRTLEALSMNDFASESVLYIFCDGPKEGATKDMQKRISENVAVAKSQTWPKELYVIVQDKNKGLADSIIDGVTKVVEKYGNIIVLEDDLITSPYFLKYMNKALEFYRDRPGVMSISANRPPIGRMQIPNDYPYDVFVSLRSYSTGWGTWKDRWGRVDWSMDYMPEFLSHVAEVEAFNRAGDDMTEMLCMQRNGKIDSWAIRFGYAHFKEHCVAILPCQSYVDNIGFDGTGIHSGKYSENNEYRNDLSLAIENPRFLTNIYEDSRIINAFYSRFCSIKRPLYQRIINTMARKIGKPAPFVIKRKVYV